MKNGIKGLLLAGVVCLGLVGCGPSKIVYDGKERPTDEVQEIISDKLEVENPNLDLEVTITEEAE
jgi:ABC-type glycerol-3-phosphate transport system substrate-binding protein